MCTTYNSRLQQSCLHHKRSHLVDAWRWGGTPQWFPQWCETQQWIPSTACRIQSLYTAHTPSTVKDKNYTTHVSKNVNCMYMCMYMYKNRTDAIVSETWMVHICTASLYHIMLLSVWHRVKHFKCVYLDLWINQIVHKVRSACAKLWLMCLITLAPQITQVSHASWRTDWPTMFGNKTKVEVCFGDSSSTVGFCVTYLTWVD